MEFVRVEVITAATKLNGFKKVDDIVLQSKILELSNANLSDIINTLYRIDLKLSGGKYD